MSEREAEVDLALERQNNIYLLEVKSGTNLNTKSLRSYADKFQPPLLMRASPRNYIRSEEFVNLPLSGLLGIESLLVR